MVFIQLVQSELGNKQKYKEVNWKRKNILRHVERNQRFTGKKAMYLHVVVFSLPLSRDTLGPPLHVVGKPKKDNYADVCGRGFKHEQVKKGFKLTVKFTLLVSALKKKDI